MIRHVYLVCVCSVVRGHCVGAEYMYFEMTGYGESVPLQHQ